MPSSEYFDPGGGLRASRSSDPFEVEADRIADEVASASSQPGRHRRGHGRDGDGELGSVGAEIESRFGVDLSNVRVRNDDEAKRSADAIGARAYNLGSEVVMGSSAETGDSSAGRRLLAHELVHVVQRQHRAVGVHERIPANTLAASWQIVDPSKQTPAVTGRTNAKVIEAGFRGICPAAKLTGGGTEVSVPTSLKSSDAGCKCLVEIEKDVAKGGKGVLLKKPKVEPNPFGWSSTSRSMSGHQALVHVRARHPDVGSYQWGYWTGKTAKSPEHRHVKPFWQTLAHEICGHVLAGVQSGGKDWGGRSTSTVGHNRAIEGENKVAAAKGVPVKEHRGLDFDPATKKANKGHRGESFLQAEITGFGNNSGVVPKNQVINDTVQSLITLAARHSHLKFRMQVEGIQSGMENAGMDSLRAGAVQTQLILALVARKAPIPVFDAIQTTVNPGPVNTGSDRAVKLFIYHKPHSAAP